MTSRSVDKARNIAGGLAVIIFPVMLLVGFISHPNLLSLRIMTIATSWIDEWYRNPLFHFAHLLVLFSVPLIIIASMCFMDLLKAGGRWYGFIGGMLSIFGAFMLAVDKGALTLVLTAFDTLSYDEITDSLPALQSLLNKEGWLWMLWLMFLLPIGFAIQLAGLMKEQRMARWQGQLAIVGLLMLINPDIEIISAIGSAMLCIGLIPVGLNLLRGDCG
jgi:hypothetical protein